jgi:hypothetical protein
VPCRAVAGILICRAVFAGHLDCHSAVSHLPVTFPPEAPLQVFTSSGTWLRLGVGLGEAVGSFNAHADNQAVITNHGGPILGPVRVLTLHGTVKGDELLNRCVVRVAGHWR